MAYRVLICDDDPEIRLLLSTYLKSNSFQVEEAKNGIECISRLKTTAFDAVLLDWRMPGMDGIEVLNTMKVEGLDVPTIVVTGHGEIDTALKATDLGAFGYLQKPFDLREILFHIEKIIKAHALSTEVNVLKNLRQKGYGKLIGDSKAMQEVYEVLDKIKEKNISAILITGESGTGKDLLAQLIHQQGPNREGLFVEIDCAALPEHLIESELFGHERGAFTDAKDRKQGLFEIAKGGTVFLDEIGEMPLNVQAKLLRTLENRHFKRVGGLVDIPFEAKIIAATNRDLKKEVENQNFREDLFFRLNVIPIQLPPLNERKEDITLLLQHFLSIFERQLNTERKSFSPEALKILLNYPWPGNVRELRNIVERIIILGGNQKIITEEMIPLEIRSQKPKLALSANPSVVLSPSGINLQEVEKSLVKQSLELSSGNQSKAAELLHITRYALRNRMKKFGLFI